MPGALLGTSEHTEFIPIGFILLGERKTKVSGHDIRLGQALCGTKYKAEGSRDVCRGQGGHSGQEALEQRLEGGGGAPQDQGNEPPKWWKQPKNKGSVAGTF